MEGMRRVQRWVGGMEGQGEEGWREGRGYSWKGEGELRRGTRWRAGWRKEWDGRRGWRDK